VGEVDGERGREQSGARGRAEWSVCYVRALGRLNHMLAAALYLSIRIIADPRLVAYVVYNGWSALCTGGKGFDTANKCAGAEKGWGGEVKGGSQHAGTGRSGDKLRS
jgi:hypothetical protein